jgi:hypothetical protein
MNQIQADVRFRYLRDDYVYHVSILKDRIAYNYKFHFLADFKEEEGKTLPRSFDVIISFNRKILFNRFPGSEEPLNKDVCKQVLDYVSCLDVSKFYL